MKTFKFFSSMTILVLLLAACKSENPPMSGVHTPPEPLEPIKYEGPKSIPLPEPGPAPKGNSVELPEPPPPPNEHDRYVQDDKLSMNYNPKVDILFVMDTSDSMYCDQDTLRKNIDFFAKTFSEGQGRFLDFHIGVVSAWDSKNFGNTDRDCDLGQLRPVGGPEGPFGTSCDANTKIPYVTRETPNLTETLGATLHLGTEKYIKGDSLRSGPEQEELFSPILAALSPESQEMNKGFRRAGHAHLAVIILSDTDDVTPGISPTDMAKYLNSMATDDLTVSTYAVLARYDELLNNLTNPINNPLKEYPPASMFNCSINPVDPHIRKAGGAPFRLQEFLKRSGGTGFDLKDPEFGQKLAAIGESIVQKTLRKVIALDYPPDVRESEPIVVKYGTQIIPKDDFKGWRYDNDPELGHIITISEGVVLEPEKDAHISIEYTPYKF